MTRHTSKRDLAKAGAVSRARTAALIHYNNVTLDGAACGAASVPTITGDVSRVTCKRCGPAVHAAIVRAAEARDAAIAAHPKGGGLLGATARAGSRPTSRNRRRSARPPPAKLAPSRTRSTRSSGRRHAMLKRYSIDSSTPPGKRWRLKISPSRTKPRSRSPNSKRP